MVEYQGNKLYSGQISTLGIRKEDVFGTRNAANDLIYAGADTFEVTPAHLFQELGDSIGNYRSGKGKSRIGKNFNFTMAGKLKNIFPLIMALGQVTKTGASSPWDYNIKPIMQDVGASPISILLPSYTIETNYKKVDGTNDDGKVALGCIANNLSMTFRQKEKVTYNLGGSVRDTDDLTISSAPTPEPEKDFSFSTTKILIDNANEVYTSGIEVYGLDNFTLNFGNNLQTDHEFNSQLVRQSYVGTLRDNAMNLRGVRRRQDTDFLTLLRNSTNFSMQIEMTRNASNDYIIITYNYCNTNTGKDAIVGLRNTIEKPEFDFSIGQMEVNAKALYDYYY
jgi:hypothetical protein